MYRELILEKDIDFVRSSYTELKMDNLVEIMTIPDFPKEAVFCPLNYVFPINKKSSIDYSHVATLSTVEFLSEFELKFSDTTHGEDRLFIWMCTSLKVRK